MLSGAAVIIYQRIDQVMIKNMIDDESVGYFATAGKFLELILFLPGILTQTVTPLLVKIRESGNTIEYEMKKRQFVGTVVWISIILATIVCLIAYPLILLTFGKEYLAAVPVLQIMAWKTVGMALSSSGGQIIIMEGIQKWAVIRNIIGCTVCIGLNLLVIPHYGIVGSAWVTIITVMISGTFANGLIPSYWKILRLQLYGLFCGWKELIYIKKLIIKK
jgi:O-antigen/teichoic acid export membrane protein